MYVVFLSGSLALRLLSLGAFLLFSLYHYRSPSYFPTFLQCSLLNFHLSLFSLAYLTTSFSFLRSSRLFLPFLPWDQWSLFISSYFCLFLGLTFEFLLQGGTLYSKMLVWWHLSQFQVLCYSYLLLCDLLGEVDFYQPCEGFFCLVCFPSSLYSATYKTPHLRAPLLLVDGVFSWMVFFGNGHRGGIMWPFFCFPLVLLPLYLLFSIPPILQRVHLPSFIASPPHPKRCLLKTPLLVMLTHWAFLLFKRTLF